MVKGFRYIPSRVAVIAIIGSFFLFNGFNSIPVYAASDISVSNSGKVSFGKVSASSTGTLATGEDTLSITTDCEAGANVYATSVNGSSTGTSLINLAAKEQDTSGANTSSYTITTSANTISSPGSLENNTWGLNTNVLEAGNGSFYGLPEYSASGLPTVIYSGTNTELPIYYGAKVTNSLAPGTYTGEVLYTVTVNNSCLDYTVKFDKNASSASGDMSDQSILPTGGTLSENSFTYSGYTFLGWSLDPAGKTGTATNGIGTTEDVDFEDKASFPGSNESILPGSDTTLYAIWSELTMQDWAGAPNWGCSKLAENEAITLTDARDNSKYTIRKFGTGRDAECWMVQNLRLGYDKGYALTNKLTNIPDGDSTTYYLPPAGKHGPVTDPNTISATENATFDSNYLYDAHIQYLPSSSTGTMNPQDTGYYNYNAASLGYSGYHVGAASGDTPRDICPKNWELPTGNTVSDRSYYNFYNTLNNSSHDDIVNPNKASLPYSSFYTSGTPYSIGSGGGWWSSTVKDSYGSYFLEIDTGSGVNPQASGNKYFGYAVRCVAKHANATGYMQNFNSSDLAKDEIIILADKRDNSEYTVKKFSDDSVWMIQNLRLGYDKGHTLTSELTNIDNGITYYIPKAGYQGSITSSSTPTSTSSSANFSHSNDNQAKVQYADASQTGSTNPQDTGYYNYYTATLGFSYYDDGKSYGTSTRDICPASWELPANEINSKSWSYFYGTLNGSAYTNMISSTGAAFPYSGVYDGMSQTGVGSSGLWWSSTTSSTYSSYFLSIHSNGNVAQDYNNRYFGLAVRCVAKDRYTINYDANGGVGEIPPSEGYTGFTLPKNTFVKDGYYFAGWSTDPSASIPTYRNGDTIRDNLTTTNGAITLYAIWFNTSTTMQNWLGCATMTDGATLSLMDSRDSSVYSIRKFGTGPSGECWMTSNLILGHDKDYTLTKDDTNIPDNAVYYIPSAGHRGDNTEAAVFDGSIGGPSIQYADTFNTDFINQQPTGYYNFMAASLNYSGYYQGTVNSSIDTPRDICPTGWELPRSSTTSDRSWYKFYNTLNSRSFSNMINLSSLSPSGYYGSNALSGVGMAGFWWSSNIIDSSYSYSLSLNTNGSINAQMSTAYKYNGYSIRCVEKETYAINYNANGGTGEMSQSKGYIGATISKNTFTKNGYYFWGWATDPSANTPTYRDADIIYDNLSTSGGSITLYAIWGDTSAPLCSSTTHPGVGAENACKMPNDKRLWFFGNHDRVTNWESTTGINTLCVNTGGITPTYRNFTELTSKEGYSQQLYSLLGLRENRSFWSSTEANTESAYSLYISNSNASISSTRKYGTIYLLCYKNAD